MEGVVYHASKTRGIKELDPNLSSHESSHGKKFLYASSSKELSMILSTRMTDMYSIIMGNGTIENPAVVVERKSGIFDKYLHKQTNIYTLDAKDFYQGTQWQGEVTTTKKQQVLNEEYIEDVYLALQSSIESGLVKLYHYPDRPPEFPKDNSDLIEHLMLPKIRTSHDYRVVSKILSIYPNLFPKVVKSLAIEMKNSIKNKLSIKEKIKKLPEGISKDKKEREEDTPHKKFVDELSKNGEYSTYGKDSQKIAVTLTDKQIYQKEDEGQEYE